MFAVCIASQRVRHTQRDREREREIVCVCLCMYAHGCTGVRIPFLGEHEQQHTLPYSIIQPFLSVAP